MSARHGGDLDRRSFLGALPVAAAASAVLMGGCTEGGEEGDQAAPQGAAAPAGRLGPLGVQLYTVRSLTGDDLNGTLAAVAEAGYEEVELAGTYGMEPAALRDLMGGLGLRAASSHQSVQEVREGWDAILEGALIRGQDHVVVPSLPGEARTADGLRAICDELNQAGEAANAAGLRFGYHNHAWEFEPYPDGTRPLEVLLERCEPHLVALQLDIYWAVEGGADPLAIIEANPGRVTTVHAKDRAADGDMAAVGQGTLDFRTLLGRALDLGLQHVFVEHDRPSDPLESIRNSYQGLRALEL